MNIRNKYFDFRKIAGFIIIILTAVIVLFPFYWMLNTSLKNESEAARIDGCGNLKILLRIILPVAMPGLIAVGLTISIFVWQELILAMTFNSIDANRPLMAGVSASITRAGIRWGQMNATGVIACIPIIIVFIFCQRYLIKGLTSGAVKG